MYNPLEKQTETKVAHAQVIYLSKVLSKTIDEISAITEYAKSTVKNYIRKFEDLLEWAKEIFETKLTKRRTSKYDLMINAEGHDIDIKSGELCYLFEFYDEAKELVCSKVGTTTRTIRDRLKEELRSYKSFGVESASVKRVYNCGDLPAEGLESIIRGEYIKKYPKSFKKNDRFFGEVFDFELCDNLAKNYLTI